MKRLVIDGEHFEVSERVSEPAVHYLRWTSGPNERYGFTTSTCSGESQIDVELEGAIRNFLDQVDPQTGYIE